MPIFGDECCFQANDDKKLVWLENGKNRCNPKGEGDSYMCSAYMCPCHGLMFLTPTQKLESGLNDPTRFLKVGNGEGKEVGISKANQFTN